MSSVYTEWENFRGSLLGEKLTSEDAVLDAQKLFYAGYYCAYMLLAELAVKKALHQYDITGAIQECELFLNESENNLITLH